jgi:hypothetical protein
MKQPRTHGAKLRGGTDAEETSIVSHEEERQNRLLHDVYNSHIKDGCKAAEAESIKRRIGK